MSIKSVINAAVSFDKAVARTACEQAIAFGEECWNTLEYAEDGSVEKETMTELLDGIEAESTWAGSGSAAARRSEWKAAIVAVPFYFIEACRYFKQAHPVGFTRVAMFKLARLLPKSTDYKSTVDQIVKDALTKHAAGKARTVKDVLKTLFKIETNKKKEKDFLRDLAKLAAKHGFDMGEIS